MFTFTFSQTLKKRLNKLKKKDKVLAYIFRKKYREVIGHTIQTIDTYKNLHSLMQEYRRIHLTNQFILVFSVDKENEHIVFIDILHWDKAYR